MRGVTSIAFARLRGGIPGANPIGRRIVTSDRAYEIVGVAANATYISLRETDKPTVYIKCDSDR